MIHLVTHSSLNPIQSFLTITVSFWSKDLIGEILSFLTEFRIQEDHDSGQYFVIRFKADILFDYDQGLKKAIYGAVSSYGIDKELIRVEIILIGFSITTKEFSVVLVQFSTLKL